MFTPGVFSSSNKDGAENGNVVTLDSQDVSEALDMHVTTKTKQPRTKSKKRKKAKDRRRMKGLSTAPSPLFIPQQNSLHLQNSPCVTNRAISQIGTDDIFQQVLTALDADQNRVRDLFNRLSTEQTTYGSRSSTFVDESQFKRRLRSFGVQLSDKYIRRVFRLIDLDGDGYIDYSELLQSAKRNHGIYSLDMQNQRWLSQSPTYKNMPRLNTSQGHRGVKARGTRPSTSDGTVRPSAENRISKRLRVAKVQETKLSESVQENIRLLSRPLAMVESSHLRRACKLFIRLTKLKALDALSATFATWKEQDRKQKAELFLQYRKQKCLLLLQKLDRDSYSVMVTQSFAYWKKALRKAIHQERVSKCIVIQGWIRRILFESRARQQLRNTIRRHHATRTEISSLVMFVMASNWGVQARDEHCGREEAAITVQSWMRRTFKRMRAMRDLLNSVNKRHASSVTITRFIRLSGRVCTSWHAAKTIQGPVRQYLHRRACIRSIRQVHLALLLQTHLTALSIRLKFKRLQSISVKYAKRKFKQETENATKLQAWFRGSIWRLNQWREKKRLEEEAWNELYRSTYAQYAVSTSKDLVTNIVIPKATMKIVVNRFVMNCANQALTRVCRTVKHANELSSELVLVWISAAIAPDDSEKESDEEESTETALQVLGNVHRLSVLQHLVPRSQVQALKLQFVSSTVVTKNLPKIEELNTPSEEEKDEASEELENDISPEEDEGTVSDLHSEVEPDELIIEDSNCQSIESQQLLEEDHSLSKDDQAQKTEENVAELADETSVASEEPIKEATAQGDQAEETTVPEEDEEKKLKRRSTTHWNRVAAVTKLQSTYRARWQRSRYVADKLKREHNMLLRDYQEERTRNQWEQKWNLHRQSEEYEVEFMFKKEEMQKQYRERLRQMVSHHRKEYHRQYRAMVFGWEQYIDRDHGLYFVNSVTGETKWEEPELWVQRRSTDHTSVEVSEFIAKHWQRTIVPDEEAPGGVKMVFVNTITKDQKDLQQLTWSSEGTAPTLFEEEPVRTTSRSAPFQVHPSEHQRASMPEENNRWVCTACEDQVADRVCEQCDSLKYCQRCYFLTHRTAQSRQHLVRLILPHESARAPDSQLVDRRAEVLNKSRRTGTLNQDRSTCAECEVRRAEWYCEHCWDCYCDECYTRLHRNKQDHKREPAANVQTSWEAMEDGMATVIYYNSVTKEITREKPGDLMHGEEKSRYLAKQREAKLKTQMERELKGLKRRVHEIETLKEKVLKERAEQDRVIESYKTRHSKTRAVGRFISPSLVK